MADEPAPVNFNLDAIRIPVLAMDGYLITSSDQSLTLNFTQSSIEASQQNIVARIAMSPAQAKELLKNLNDHIEKFEI